MKKTISKVLMPFGALLVLGSAGDSDVQRIPFGAVIVKLIIGIALFAVGYILYKKSKHSRTEVRECSQNNEICQQ